MRPFEHNLAFTLVELILVMALLTIVMAVAAPSLSKFFRGRDIETEAGRFVALTRYGQSQAVSLGKPMVLWVDPQEGSYGLDEQGTSPANRVGASRNGTQSGVSDGSGRYFELREHSSIEVGRTDPLTNGLASIRFTPDGAIDENSVKAVFIRDDENGAIPIQQSRNRLYYEVGERTNMANARR
jgi:prepilin-type N-terminal cleavage/methylation domain-containing protein